MHCDPSGDDSIGASFSLGWVAASNPTQNFCFVPWHALAVSLSVLLSLFLQHRTQQEAYDKDDLHPLICERTLEGKSFFLCGVMCCLSKGGFREFTTSLAGSLVSHSLGIPQFGPSLGSDVG